jgi:hypothetical protein
VSLLIVTLDRSLVDPDQQAQDSTEFVDVSFRGLEVVQSVSRRATMKPWLRVSS